MEDPLQGTDELSAAHSRGQWVRASRMGGREQAGGSENEKVKRRVSWSGEGEATANEWLAMRTGSGWTSYPSLVRQGGFEGLCLRVEEDEDDDDGSRGACGRTTDDSVLGSAHPLWRGPSACSPRSGTSAVPGAEPAKAWGRAASTGARRDAGGEDGARGSEATANNILTWRAERSAALAHKDDDERMWPHPPIDIVGLSERCGEDMSLVNQVLGTSLCDQGEVRMDSLDAALLRQDREQLLFDADFVMGMACNIGARDLERSSSFLIVLLGCSGADCAHRMKSAAGQVRFDFEAAVEYWIDLRDADGGWWASASGDDQRAVVVAAAAAAVERRALRAQTQPIPTYKELHSPQAGGKDSALRLNEYLATAGAEVSGDPLRGWRRASSASTVTEDEPTEDAQVLRGPDEEDEEEVEGFALTEDEEGEEEGEGAGFCPPLVEASAFRPAPDLDLPSPPAFPSTLGPLLSAAAIRCSHSSSSASRHSSRSGQRSPERGASLTDRVSRFCSVLEEVNSGGGFKKGATFDACGSPKRVARRMSEQDAGRESLGGEEEEGEEDPEMSAYFHKARIWLSEMYQFSLMGNGVAVRERALRLRVASSHVGARGMPGKCLVVENMTQPNRRSLDAVEQQLDASLAIYQSCGLRV